jgi:diguanylate cyclase (GGDEF)-like protein
MTDTLDSQPTPFPILQPDTAQLASLDSQMGVSLANAVSDPPEITGADAANIERLTRARLGVASSLYVALRCKSVQSATHGLRVSLLASGWATGLRLPEGLREAIEVAALLHDVGMIGLPDEILRKPGPLNADEIRMVDDARKMSVTILRNACAQPKVLEIVEHVPAWYDGSRAGYSLRGDDLPLGARMIAIAEAFDAMTIDQVYRPAMSLERAGFELFAGAGVQFDPKLVNGFVEFHSGNLDRIREEVAGRWLQTLAPEISNSYWALTDSTAQTKDRHDMRFFEDRLLDNMHDAVVFIDASMRVLQWNHGAERMTGINATSICDRRWAPTLLNIQGEKGTAISEEDCPVISAITSGVQSLRRLSIGGRSRDRVAVDTHAIPVVDPDGAILGAVLILHDASSETSLEERCQSLHTKATRDPLTQVANRAEFDRVFELFINTHRQQRVPCSLIICDLDKFKRINDTYGHQAGDEAIKTLAKLLKSSCRPGDLVARYGGEEFVMLCADCDNAAAARRADEIRKRLEQTPQAALEGRSITASFGVTEIQPGDTSETMLRRSDRGLLIAKEKGRNTVVQLGAGASESEEAPVFWGRAATGGDCCFSTELHTPMPLSVLREKLIGFVADHQAKVLRQDDNGVIMRLENRRQPQRRRADRSVSFEVSLNLSQRTDSDSKCQENAKRNIPYSCITVTIRPRRLRDRRRDGVEAAARDVIASLRSYLGATEAGGPQHSSVQPMKMPSQPWWRFW